MTIGKSLPVFVVLFEFHPNFGVKLMRIGSEAFGHSLKGCHCIRYGLVDVMICIKPSARRR